jgi:hypothetical protein
MGCFHSLYVTLTLPQDAPTLDVVPLLAVFQQCAPLSLFPSSIFKTISIVSLLSTSLLSFHHCVPFSFFPSVNFNNHFLFSSIISLFILPIENRPRGNRSKCCSKFARSPRRRLPICVRRRPSPPLPRLRLRSLRKIPTNQHPLPLSLRLRLHPRLAEPVRHPRNSSSSREAVWQASASAARMRPR